MKGIRQLSIFAAVGAVGFLVDVGVLYLTSPSAGPYGGRLVSFIAAATFTWWFNSRLTFERAGRRKKRAQEYSRYMTSMLAGAAINYAIYALTLHWSRSIWAPALGVALGSVCGLFINFGLARLWVFEQGNQSVL